MFFCKKLRVWNQWIFVCVQDGILCDDILSIVSPRTTSSEKPNSGNEKLEQIESEHNVKISYFLIWCYISPNEFLRERKIRFRYIKNAIFFKFWRHLNLPPFWSAIRIRFPLAWFGMSWDVDSRTRDFRLDSSRLFYFCKFNLVVHTKRRKGAILHGQARWVKPEVTCSWICGTGRQQENRIFSFLKFHKKSRFIQIEILCRRSPLHEI